MPRDKGVLTTKAVLLLNDFLMCGLNVKKTALKENRSYQSTYTQLHQPYVQRIFQELLQEMGVTKDKLAQRLNEGLDATKVVGYLNNKVKGTQKVSDEFVEVPDYQIRHKYLTTALECLDIIKYNNKVDVKVNNTVNITNIKQVIENANRVITGDKSGAGNTSPEVLER